MAPICWAMVILLSAVEIGGYYLWRRKARAAAETDDSFIPTHSHAFLQKLVLTLVFLMLAFWLTSLGSHFAVGILSCLNVLLMILLANGIKKLLKKMGASAGVNLVVTVIAVFVLTIVTITGLIYFVGKNRNIFFAERTPVETYEFYGHTQNVYKDPLPLTLEDLGVENVDPDHYSYEKEESGSPFASQVNGRQWERYDAPDGIPSIEYSITTVHTPFLFEKTRKSILASYGRYNRPDTPPEGWGSVLPRTPRRGMQTVHGGRTLVACPATSLLYVKATAFWRSPFTPGNLRRSR